MNIHNFPEDEGIEAFPDGMDDIDKRTVVHHLLQELDAPAHLFVDVDGNKIILMGNVLNQEYYKQIIDKLGKIRSIAIIYESIIISEE